MLGYALLGLILGVFVNHMADLLPRRESLWRAPLCPVCQRPRSLWQWSALIAYLTGHWRCAVCGGSWRVRHLLAELASALLFAHLWARYGPGVQLALLTLYTLVFLLVFLIDLEHRLILNVVIYPAILLAVIGSFLRPDLSARLVLVGGLVGYALVFLIYLGGPLFVRFWSRLRGRTTQEVPFGFGDVNLALFIGLVVGFPAVIFALVLGILFGGIGALTVLLVRAVGQGRYHELTPIPYGPFLIAGGMIMMFFGPQIMSAYLGAYS